MFHQNRYNGCHPKTDSSLEPYFPCARSNLFNHATFQALGRLRAGTMSLDSGVPLYSCDDSDEVGKLEYYVTLSLNYCY